MAIDWGLADLLALLPTARAGIFAIGLVIVLVESFLVSLSRPVEGYVQEKESQAGHLVARFPVD